MIINYAHKVLVQLLQMRFFFFVFVRYIYMVVILKRRCFGMIHRKREYLSLSSGSLLGSVGRSQVPSRGCSVRKFTPPSVATYRCLMGSFHGHEDQWFGAKSRRAIYYHHILTYTPTFVNLQMFAEVIQNPKEFIIFCVS